MSEEKWLPIPGYEGIYDVSDLGRVRSYYVGRGAGRVADVPQRILKPGPSSGYPSVVLHTGVSRKTVRVGRLVLETFVGPCPEYMVMCHAPGSGPDDCGLAVLRWDTRGANQSNRFGNRRLTDGDILEMRQKRADGATIEELEVEYDRTNAAISRICHGKQYIHIGGPRVATCDLENMGP